MKFEKEKLGLSEKTKTFAGINLLQYVLELVVLQYSAIFEELHEIFQKPPRQLWHLITTTQSIFRN